MVQRRDFAARSAAVLLGLVLVLFAPSAYRIDEPNIIAIAEQISAQPLDPYGFEINWLGTEEPAYRVLANPPLTPYWLAIWGSLFGWNETILHLSMVPFALLAFWSMLQLSRNVVKSDRGSLLFLISPAVVLAATVVMPDVMALSLTLFAVAVGFDERRRESLWWTSLGCLAAAAAVVAKYNAIVVVVPLAALFVIHRRKTLLFLAASAPLGLALWSYAGWVKYGSAHVLLHAGSQAAAGVFPLHGTLTAFGLATFPLVIGIPLLLKGERWSIAITCAAAIAAAVSAIALQYEVIPAALVVVATSVAVRVLLLPFDRSTLSLSTRVVLGLWMYVALAFQMRQLFAAVRYTLPMLPPALLLVVGAFSVGMRRATLLVASSFGVLLVALLAIADATDAHGYRRVAQMAAAKSAASGGTLYYSGHWGAQFYLERLGARQYARSEKPPLRCGDLLVVAREALPEIRRADVARPCVEKWSEVRFDSVLPIRTIDCAARANFYGPAVGGCDRFPLLLPFGISRGEDVFDFEEAVRPN